MKHIVAFSGGKDSLATLIWAKANLSSFEVVFCDTGWEHEETYKHIKKIEKQFKMNFTVLKSKKHSGFYDMSLHKKRVASTKARFCTEELKVKPMIDYLLTMDGDIIVYQGIRADESNARSKMKAKDEYFYLYTSPTKKKGLYRRKDVLSHLDNYSVDVVRPIFKWTAMEVFEYIYGNGYQPNKLYKQGFSRVGCMPCVQSRHSEVKQMIERYPKYFERLEALEKQIGRTFFPPKYIPSKFCSKIVQKEEMIEMLDGKKEMKTTSIRVPTAMDVKKYLLRGGKSFFSAPSCQSIYAICE